MLVHLQFVIGSFIDQHLMPWRKKGSYTLA